jgi:hypothetical protein
MPLAVQRTPDGLSVRQLRGRAKNYDKQRNAPNKKAYSAQVIEKYAGTRIRTVDLRITNTVF